MSGALWQRLKQHGRRIGVDPRLTTELGRLNWFGELTTAQTAAGHRIAGIYGRYEGLNGLRRSTQCRSSPSYVSAVDEADAIRGDRPSDADMQTIIHNATMAFQALGREIPFRMRAAIEDLCVNDAAVSPAWYPDLRILFQRLAVSWKITGGARQEPKPEAGKGRAHTPLHFNRHEGEQDSVPAASAPAVAPRPNLDRIFWIVVARKIAPHLTEEQLGEAFEFQQALKQREIVRRSKAGRLGNVVPLAR